MAKKRKNNKLFIYLGSAAVLLIIMSMVGKKQGWFGEKDKTEVTFAMAKKVSIIETVSASGMVQPILEVKISPEVPGEIIELNIEEGDPVKQGDVLIKIRPDNLLSALDRTQAALDQQKANQATAQANLAKARASFERSKLEYDRQKHLHENEAISNADMELATANYEIANQDLQSAIKNTEAAQYIVKSAEASVKEAKENLRFTTIKAPMTGTVSKLDVEKGERVVGTSQMAGTEMLRIADLNNMEVQVDVNENDIVRVSIGDEVDIEVDAYTYLDKKFKGIVTAIANTANQKATPDAVTEFQVKIRILNESFADLVKKNNSSPFRPGMTASVDIITEEKDDILSVPLGAVTTRVPEDEEGDEDEELSEKKREEKLKEVVFVNREGKAVMVEVKTGISDFDNIEIIDGLKPEDQVVTGPFLAVSKKLEDGDDIKEKEKKDKKDKKDDEERS